VANFIHAVHDHGVGFSLLSRFTCGERGGGGGCYASIRNAAEYCVAAAERTEAGARAGNCMLANVTCDCLLDFLPVVESLSDYYEKKDDSLEPGDGIVDKTRDAEAPCM
jgi:hypothetical protein